MWLEEDQGLWVRKRAHFGWQFQHQLWETNLPVYIPIRNPYDVALSWEARSVNDDRPIDDMMNCFREMWRFLGERHGSMQVVPIQMETLPILADRSVGPDHPCRRDRETFARHPRILALSDAIRDSLPVRDFYDRYYTQEQLWWLHAAR